MSAITPKVAALLDQGLASQRTGDMAAALKVYEEILENNPAQPDALWLKGVALFQSGNTNDALTLLKSAINIRPGDAAIWNDLGMVFEAIGESERARLAFEKAAGLDPSLASAQVNIARMAMKNNDAQSALAAADRAIVTQPSMKKAHIVRGNALRALVRPDDALAAYAVVLARESDNAEALLNKGLLLHEQGNLESARAALQRTLKSAEHRSSIWADATMTLGLIEAETGDLATARQHYDAVLTVVPGHTGALVNRGELRQRLGDLGGSESDYNQALDGDPASIVALYNRSLLRLLQERWSEGWDDYKCRWQSPHFDSSKRDRGLTAWDGSLTQGLKLLVWGEQGLGDQILFAEPLSDLTAAGMIVSVEVDPKLVPLLARNRSDLSVYGYDAIPLEVINDCDAQIPIGSLGRFLRRKAEAYSKTTSFLAADSDSTRTLRVKYSELAQGRTLVGIAWHSINPSFGGEKSLPLEQWGPILQTEDAVFISLQYGSIEDAVTAARKRTGADVYVDAEVDPFLDLDLAAAQISAMDVVIATSNTTVHIAGALGQEAWVMVPRVPEWRWGISGERVPWYPSVRVFRQPKVNDWSGVMTKVSDALLEKIQNQR